jgi:photosystem II stability/assembly factor-like uncharacterized protein
MTAPRWEQARMYGGGFIAGLLQDPLRPHILYARSDVAGIFKSTDGGRSWAAKNNGLTSYHQHDTQTFAISPHDPDVLFRCSGSVRGGHFFGAIHKSADGGESWRLVCRDAPFYGNGEARNFGEMIQVDPHDAAHVVAGSYTNGVWASRDAGETWSYAGLKHERIGCVAFHPARPGVVYIGTLGHYDKNPKFVAQQHDYVRPNPGRLYCSEDGGVTWQVLHEGLDFAALAIDLRRPDLLHAACVWNGVQRSDDGGRTWTNHAPGLSKYEIGSLAHDPRDPDHLYCAAVTFPNVDPEVPPIGLYETTDAGASWHLVRWHTEADLRNYPSYMSLPYAGWAISKVRVDALDSRTLYISNWYGVSISRDGGHTWDANHFAGMENVCVENMTAHPARPGTVFMVMADHPPRVSTDGGCTYLPMPRPQVDKVQPDSTAVVASRFRPDLVLYAMKGFGACSILRTNLRGDDPQVVFQRLAAPDTEESVLALQSRAAGVSVHALVEDPFTAGTFYAYLDGLLEAGAGVMRSTDWGDTWERLPFTLPGYITRIPHERFWIENELLSVVIAQTKNVCGTNQLFAADPHRQGTLYAGEWTEGLWRSDDGGMTWQNISRGLPFKRERASVLNVIRADGKRPGVLYAGFIREGVWRSTDYGETWARAFPLDERVAFNATTLAVGGADGDLVVAACEPLYWSACRSAVMVSRDAGGTWADVYDPRLGAVRWKTVTLEPGADLLYAGSCGNSAFRLNLSAGAAS